MTVIILSFLVIVLAVGDNIYVLFGRTDKNEFILDFQWPFSPIQAFGIALSSLEKKIAVDW